MVDEAHPLREAGAGGLNPLTPTNIINNLRDFGEFLIFLGSYGGSNMPYFSAPLSIFLDERRLRQN